MYDSNLGLLLLSLLLLVSVVLAGSEAALAALPDSHIRKQMQEGRWKQVGFRLWLERLPRLVTSFQMMRVLVHVAAGAQAALLAAAHHRPPWQIVGAAIGVALGFALMTAVARTLGRNSAERLAPAAARVARTVDLLLFPASWAVSSIAAWLRREPPAGDTGGPRVSEGQLEYLIELGRQQGVVSEQQERMLSSVLELPSTTVRELMVPRVAVEALRVGMPIRDVINKVLTDGHSRYPVYGRNSEDVVGVVYTKDLFKAVIDRGPLQTRLVELVRKPLYLPVSLTVDVALRRLQAHRMHLAIVVDEFGSTAGVVTLEDILEEIVGDIADEHDAQEEPIRRMGDGRYVVDGSVPLRDLGDRLDLAFPEGGDYETLAGFLADQAGRVPGTGEEIDWGELHFVVREADERHVTKVEIAFRSPEAPGE